MQLSINSQYKFCKILILQLLQTSFDVIPINHTFECNNLFIWPIFETSIRMHKIIIFSRFFTKKWVIKKSAGKQIVYVAEIQYCIWNSDRLFNFISFVNATRFDLMTYITHSISLNFLSLLILFVSYSLYDSFIFRTLHFEL